MVYVCIGLAALVFAADLLIKNRIEKEEGLPRTALGGKILLQRYHNRGAALNFLEKRPRLVTWLSVFLTLFSLFLFVLSLGRRGNRLLQLSLALLLGGAFSNTYDRLRRKYVVDYVSFRVGWKRLAGVVFNLSDFCIIVGALLACLVCGHSAKGI